MKNHLARKHFERGRQFELQDQIEAASEAYGAAVALGPDFAEPFVSLARIEASRGHHERALELFDDALERDADTQTIEWRAYVLGRLRRYSEALVEYRRILDEGDPQVRVNVARMLLALRRYDEAQEVLESSDEAAAAVLLEALPRYREYQDADRTDDGRAVRYLFGRTLVLGTATAPTRCRSPGAAARSRDQPVHRKVPGAARRASCGGTDRCQRSSLARFVPDRGRSCRSADTESVRRWQASVLPD